MPNKLMAPEEAIREITAWAKGWFERNTPSPSSLTHMDWARQQMPLSSALRSITQVDLNPILHHCSIGKITLKQSDKAV